MPSELTLGWDETNEKMHMYSNNQIHMGVDTIIYFVIQSGQLSVDRAISMLHYVNCLGRTLISVHVQ